MADTTEKPEARLSDWDRLAHRRGPNLLRWMLISLMAGGVMLYASPIVSSTSVLISVAAVLLSPLTFLLGWMAGMSTFARSYEPFRRRHRPWSFAFLLPVILAMTIGLGLLGGKYWWLLSFGLAFLGHRKGTQRAWWSAVAYLAFLFREPAFGFSDSPPLVQNDEDALAKAIEVVNEDIEKSFRWL
jgi:hypothetical protein